MLTNMNLVGYTPSITGTLTLADNTSISITDADFVTNTFAIKDATSTNDEFAIGAAAIKTISFQLYNNSGRFDNIDWTNSMVEIVFTYNDTNPATVLNMGTYMIMTHKASGYRINIEAGDKMKVLDEHLFYEVNQWSTVLMNTAETVVGQIAAYFGLSVAGLNHGTLNIVDYNEDMTIREVLSNVAQCVGQFVYMNGDTITFEWYDSTNIYDVGTAFSVDVRTSDITITGVKVIANDGRTTQTRGTSDYELLISNNNCIDTRNISDVADYIYAAVNGITFRPGTVTVRSNAAVEAGDFVRVNTGQETIVMLATNVKWQDNIRMTLTADANPEDSDLRVTKAQRLSGMIQNEAEKEINKQLENSNSKLSQAIAQGGSGGGDRKIGGPSGAYGYVRAYNNNDRMIMAYTQAGVFFSRENTVGSTTTMQQQLSITQDGIAVKNGAPVELQGGSTVTATGTDVQFKNTNETSDSFRARLRWLLTRTISGVSTVIDAIKIATSGVVFGNRYTYDDSSKTGSTYDYTHNNPVDVQVNGKLEVSNPLKWENNNDQHVFRVTQPEISTKATSQADFGNSIDVYIGGSTTGGCTKMTTDISNGCITAVQDIYGRKYVDLDHVDNIYLNDANGTGEKVRIQFLANTGKLLLTYEDSTTRTI